MTEKQIRMGAAVTSLSDFVGVPKGTVGIIDEDYGTGIMVAWDLPDQHLPKNYKKYDGRPAFQSNILRDGFDKEDELQYLHLVESGNKF